jgi:hypothetical protein
MIHTTIARGRWLIPAALLLAAIPLCGQQAASAGVDLPPNSQETGHLTIVNNCRVPESFYATSSLNSDWLKFEGKSFELASGSRKNFEFTVNTAGLSPGQYQATLTFICTTCYKEPVCKQSRGNFPVSLTVTAPSAPRGGGGGGGGPETPGAGNPTPASNPTGPGSNNGSTPGATPGGPNSGGPVSRGPTGEVGPNQNSGNSSTPQGGGTPVTRGGTPSPSGPVTTPGEQPAPTRGGTNPTGNPTTPNRGNTANGEPPNNGSGKPDTVPTSTPGGTDPLIPVTGGGLLVALGLGWLLVGSGNPKMPNPATPKVPGDGKVPVTTGAGTTPGPTEKPLGEVPGAPVHPTTQSPGKWDATFKVTPQQPVTPVEPKQPVTPNEDDGGSWNVSGGMNQHDPVSPATPASPPATTGKTPEQPVPVTPTTPTTDEKEDGGTWNVSGGIDQPEHKPGDLNEGGGRTFGRGTTPEDLAKANTPTSPEEQAATKAGIPTGGKDDYAERETKIRDRMAQRQIAKESPGPISVNLDEPWTPSDNPLSVSSSPLQGGQPSSGNTGVGLTFSKPGGTLTPQTVGTGGVAPVTKDSLTQKPLLPDGDLVQLFFRELWDDFASGRARDRLPTFFENLPKGFAQAAVGTVESIQNAVTGWRDMSVSQLAQLPDAIKGAYDDLAHAATEYARAAREDDQKFAAMTGNATGNAMFQAVLGKVQAELTRVGAAKMSRARVPKTAEKPGASVPAEGTPVKGSGGLPETTVSKPAASLEAQKLPVSETPAQEAPKGADPGRIQRAGEKTDVYTPADGPKQGPFQEATTAAKPGANSKPQPEAGSPNSKPMNERKLGEVPIDPKEAPGTRLPPEHDPIFDDPSDPPILTHPKTGEPVPAHVDPKTGDIVPNEPVPGLPGSKEAAGPHAKAPPGDSGRGSVDPKGATKDIPPNERPWNKVSVDPNQEPGTRLPPHDALIEDPSDPPILTHPETGEPVPAHVDPKTGDIVPNEPVPGLSGAKSEGSTPDMQPVRLDPVKVDPKGVTQDVPAQKPPSSPPTPEGGATTRQLPASEIPTPQSPQGQGKTLQLPKSELPTPQPPQGQGKTTRPPTSKAQRAPSSEGDEAMRKLIEDAEKAVDQKAAGSTPSTLDKGLDSYFKGRDQPPMHTTSSENLQKIRMRKQLDAPERGGASWSYSGTLRDGDVAIRLKPGAEKYVELVPAEEGFGQVPRYYPSGVGRGPYKSYVPSQYLEYFDVLSGKWLAL